MLSNRTAGKSHPTNICSKLTKETLEQNVKCVESEQ